MVRLRLPTKPPKTASNAWAPRAWASPRAPPGLARCSRASACHQRDGLRCVEDLCKQAYLGSDVDGLMSVLHRDLCVGNPSRGVSESAPCGCGGAQGRGEDCQKSIRPVSRSRDDYLTSFLRTLVAIATESPQKAKGMCSSDAQRHRLARCLHRGSSIVASAAWQDGGPRIQKRPRHLLLRLRSCSLCMPCVRVRASILSVVVTSRIVVVRLCRVRLSGGPCVATHPSQSSVGGDCGGGGGGVVECHFGPLRF